MRKYPVMEFKSKEQAIKYLEEWKRRLFLDDWIIKIKLVDKDEIPGQLGENHFQIINKTSCIMLCIPDDELKNRIMKFCAEKTLVHELLHLIFDYDDLFENTYEGRYASIIEHQNVEKLAKSLIMAKYNLEPDWFKNF